MPAHGRAGNRFEAELREVAFGWSSSSRYTRWRTAGRAPGRMRRVGRARGPRPLPLRVRRRPQPTARARRPRYDLQRGGADDRRRLRARRASCARCSRRPSTGSRVVAPTNVAAIGIHIRRACRFDLRRHRVTASMHGPRRGGAQHDTRATSPGAGTQQPVRFCRRSPSRARCRRA